jgi:hypothetical protein
MTIPHQLTLDELAPTGEELRDAGIRSLERHPWLERARLAAVRLCELQGWVTSDDVQKWMADDPVPHVNAWGAVFHDARFRSTDRTVPTTRPLGHYRRVMVWRLA